MSDLSLTAAFIAQATGGTLRAPSDATVSGVCIDSRNAKPGDLFVALPGQRVDGHRFVASAIEAGAACALVSKPCDSSLPTVLVDDTAAALGRLAHAYRKTLSPLTVGVTGSVGKTTTKQLITSVLSVCHTTHHTEGNFNNALGLPLTLLSLRPEHEAAVIEMGMSEIGEIEYLSRLALPDIGVITCIGTSHIETLGSRERIRDAKLEIRAGMKENGVLILNGDEPLLRGIEGAIYVGHTPEGARTRRIENMRASDAEMTFDLVREDGSAMRNLTIPGRGSHLVFDAALACTVGEMAGMREEQIRAGLMRFENTGMRQSIEHRNGLTLITDCYNAAPESMKAALNVLSDLRTDGRCIAVLGDMLELGSYSEQAHTQVGEYAAQKGIDLLLTFGERARAIAQGAKSAGMAPERILSFPDITAPEAVSEALHAVLRPSDVILFKASRGIALERVINRFKEKENHG